IDRMATFGKNASRQQDARARDLAGLDAAAQRQRVERVRAEIPDGRDAPPREQILHVLTEHRGGCAGSIPPHPPGEMNVAVPESRNHGLSRAIDDAPFLRKADSVALSNRRDRPARDGNGGVVEWSDGRRGIDLASD